MIRKHRSSRELNSALPLTRLRSPLQAATAAMAAGTIATAEGTAAATTRATAAGTGAATTAGTAPAAGTEAGSSAEADAAAPGPSRTELCVVRLPTSPDHHSYGSSLCHLS